MMAVSLFKKFWGNFESYTCQFLLSFFIVMLFVQILFREMFDYSISWGEELARFAFVWFVYFGAAYASKMSAHNRVTFQFKFLPKKVVNYIEAFSDLIWVFFNIVMIYKSIFLIKSMLQFPYVSPTLGWSMAYIYCIFPLAFTAMTIRIIQVNYLKLVKGVDIMDPDRVEVDAVIKGEKKL